MNEEGDEYRWSNDAVKDWVFSILVNTPFPIIVLILASLTGSYELHPRAVWYWLGTVAAVAIVLAAGIPFAGWESRIFTRVIDGVYILGLSQRFPVFQVGLMAASAAVWNISMRTCGSIAGGHPLLEGYFVAFVYCQASLVFSFVLGCMYRKPRDYPRWLRPWNHDFDRDNDTLTRR